MLVVGVLVCSWPLAQYERHEVHVEGQLLLVHVVGWNLPVAHVVHTRLTLVEGTVVCAVPAGQGASQVEQKHASEVHEDAWNSPEGQVEHTRSLVVVGSVVRSVPGPQ